MLQSLPPITDASPLAVARKAVDVLAKSMRLRSTLANVTLLTVLAKMDRMKARIDIRESASCAVMTPRPVYGDDRYADAMEADLAAVRGRA